MTLLIIKIQRFEFTRFSLTVVFPPISAEKVDIARCYAPHQKNANNTRSKILLQKKVGAIDNTEC